MKRYFSGKLFAFLVLFTLCAAAVSGSEEAKIEGAKREGQLLWYTSINLTDARDLVDRFQQRYPFVRVNLYRAGGSQVVNRILVEKQAGKSAFDVASTSGLAILKQRGLLQAYPSSPDTEALGPQNRDAGHFWYGFYALYYVVGYNTRMVSEAEVPRDWEDLLRPRWKGGIVMDPDDYDWYGGFLEARGGEKGGQFARRLAQQGIQWRNNHALITQLITAGEFPVGITYAHRVEAMKGRGAPVDWVKTLKPIIVGLTPVGISADARNPNAARLFLDFLISKPVQEEMPKMGRIPVRKDVDPFPGVSSAKLTTHVIGEKVTLQLGRYAKEFRKIFSLE